MEIRLTKDSRRTLKAIYDTYCQRRKEGQSKKTAIRFIEPDYGGLDAGEFEDSKVELCKAGLIQLDIVGNFELTDDAIVFMENFKKDAILKWLEFGSNLIP